LRKSIAGVFRIPANWRSLTVFGFDLCAVVIAWLMALGVRFNFTLPPDYYRLAVIGLLLLVPMQAVIFRAAGLYRGIWVFASLPDLMRLAKAILASGLAVAVGGLMLQPEPAFPRSMLLLYPMFLAVIMGGGRVTYRVFKEQREYGAHQTLGRPVLVLGVGRAAASLVQQLAHSKEWQVVGLLDDDPATRHREVCGIRVLGPISSLAEWAGVLKVRHAIIAMPEAGPVRYRDVANICMRAGIKAFTLPPIGQIIAGHGSVSQMRRLNLEDLLGREAVVIDTPQVRELLSGRVVMVTGAGGSIGAELCRQIARFGPAQIVAFEQSEYALYLLAEQFAEIFPEIPLVAVAGDVKDRRRVLEVLEKHVPAVVFHAAAYKHVPLMEENNSWQAVRNNALGTWVVGHLSDQVGVKRFVLVSTDKAVNPTNVMGATKRLAEIICQVLQVGARSTRYEIVRFGNVLGSAGSVIPKFQAQIERGGPVTVTHPEITRYFMAVHEAVQLVLQAAAMGEGGEIFVLDMGEPVKVLDLARDMIRLSGHAEDDIPIVFSGLRPGEKLYEEVLADSECTRPTHHPKLRVAWAAPPDGFAIDSLIRWINAARVLSDDEVRRDLRRWVPEYVPYNPPRPYLVEAETRRA